MMNAFGYGDHRKYHLYRKETDMRKGFDSLCGIISGELGKRVLDGDVFVFISRPRTHIKLLVWESGGFTLLYRRLVKRNFEFSAFYLEIRSMQINSSQMQFFLKGNTLKEIK